MSLSVTASAPPAQAANPPTAAPTAQQVAQLNQLVGKYKTAISHNGGADVLASLARQIAAASKALGQNVVLPKAPSGSSGPPSVANAGHAEIAQSAENPRTSSGKVNVKA